MQQIPLNDEFGGKCSEKIFIQYDGINEDLARHEIDAITYSISISGYTVFTKKMIEALFGKDVQVRIVAHKKGSFIDVFNISWDTVYKLGGVLAIATWFGIDAKLVGKAVKNIIIFTQKKIVDLIIEAGGNTDAIIKSIYNSSELTQEEKDLLINFMRDNDVRKGLDSFTSPLDKNGYDKIEVSNEAQEKYYVTSSQRPAFKYIPQDIIEEEQYTDIVSIVYLSPELSKWQFQGKRIFWADIHDDIFLNNTKGKKFSDLKGKRYSVSGTKRITRNDGKIKGTPIYTIETAIEIPEPLSLL